ncbi:methyl-accepting chemotaxis protein [Alkalimonas sp. MEB108]|uniref:Methyl-accepting chemotaxis protein n=1 Tax=Alkalimonas cellulosilytica TaxID=3058395 RepID=A0ABU7J4D7_9GAMM|nr:methyl-accepting chemotaxis protein [Alkalimonas sp. MEB108]MEE2000875.1 methyl-accepting chemotaxis protein [Alkalimonas sp. MEB108]
MTIKLMFRIGLGAALAATLVLLLIVLALRSTMLQTQQLQDYRYQAYQLGQDSSLNSTQLTMLARQYIATLDRHYLQQYNDLVAVIQGESAGADGRRLSYVDRLRAMNFTQAELQQLERSNQLSMALIATEEAAFALVESMAGQDPASLTQQQLAAWVQAHALLNGRAYMTEVSAIMQPVAQFEQMLDERTASSVAQVQQRLALIVAISLIAVLTIILVLAICYWLIEQRVIRPTDRLLGQVRVISQGDLSQPVAASSKQDEIGLLTQAFGTMTEQLNQLLQQIYQQAQSAHQSASELTQVATQTAQINEEQQASIQVISSSVYQNTQAVREVASNCSHAAKDASNADQQTEQGQQVVHDSIGAVASLSDSLKASTQDLAELENSVNQVASILDVITNIAGQTNLLALNAAIEAARAGEQGRGFAVVADEVRTLAQRTQSSTTEIRQRIEALQQVTSSMGLRIRQSDSEVQVAVDKASDVAATLQSIQQLMKGIHDMTTTIAAATEQQSSVSDDISERLIRFQDTTNQSSEQGQQVAAQARRLKDLAESLNQTLGRFKLRTTS